MAKYIVPLKTLYNETTSQDFKPKTFCFECPWNNWCIFAPWVDGCNDNIKKIEEK